MAYQQDAFAVMSREDVFQIVKNFKTRLESRGILVQKMYLYGSYAKGNPHYGSDIDICVISPTFKNKFEAELLLSKEGVQIDSRIETVAYTPETFENWIPLVWEIKQNGIVMN
ncbi:MAG: nucleotidyltransferase domain-containing protein [Patescibacteria group bacterium]